MRTIYMYKVLHQTYDVTCEWPFGIAPAILNDANLIIVKGYGYPMWAWAAVEADLGIICASAPALKPFFKKYLNAASYSSAFARSRNTNKHEDEDGTPINSQLKSQRSAKDGPRIHVHELNDIESHYQDGFSPRQDQFVSRESLTRFDSSRDSSIPEFGKDGTHHDISSV